MAMFCSAYSMQRYLSPRKLSALCYIVGEENKKDIAWEIVLNQGIAFFDYTMIRALAVNHHFDEILRRTADNRKMYLQKYACRSDCDYHKEYNGSCIYGAVNGKVLIESISNLVYIITIERNCLLSPMSSPDSYNVNSFHDVLPHQPSPFFNQHGDFCFYGYGEKSGLLNVKSGTVVLYSLSVEGVQKIIECAASIKQRIYRLRIFLEFPYLLRAFLNSRKVYQQMIDDKIMKIFDFKGVTIPKDYATHQKYFSDFIQYESFDELSEWVQKNIVAQYKKQCARKKKKI
jgi:hypothetical protein